MRKWAHFHTIFFIGFRKKWIFSTPTIKRQFSLQQRKNALKSFSRLRRKKKNSKIFRAFGARRGWNPPVGIINPSAHPHPFHPAIPEPGPLQCACGCPQVRKTTSENQRIRDSVNQPTKIKRVAKKKCHAKSSCDYAIRQKIFCRDVAVFTEGTVALDFRGLPDKNSNSLLSLA